MAWPIIKIQDVYSSGAKISVNYLFHQTTAAQQNMLLLGG
jgi:hypothetical protein